jgi:hypothetical protein
MCHELPTRETCTKLLNFSNRFTRKTWGKNGAIAGAPNGGTHYPGAIGHGILKRGLGMVKTC